jgi:hypothetical protein
MKKMTIAFAAALALASFGGCKKKGGAGEAMAKMGEFKDKMCKCSDKACADKVTDEMTKWSQEMAKTADKEAKVSEEDTKKMQEVTEEFTKCATKAMTAGAGAPPAGGDMKKDDKPAGDTAAAPAGGSTGIAECDDYRAEMEKIAKCDKIPQQARDTMKQGFDAASAAWKDLASAPKEAKDAAASACKSAADAAKTALAACN